MESRWCFFGIYNCIYQTILILMQIHSYISSNVLFFLQRLRDVQNARTWVFRANICWATFSWTLCLRDRFRPWDIRMSLWPMAGPTVSRRHTAHGMKDSKSTDSKRCPLNQWVNSTTQDLLLKELGTLEMVLNVWHSLWRLYCHLAISGNPFSTPQR